VRPSGENFPAAAVASEYGSANATTLTTVTQTTTSVTTTSVTQTTMSSTQQQQQYDSQQYDSQQYYGQVLSPPTTNLSSPEQYGGQSPPQGTISGLQSTAPASPGSDSSIPSTLSEPGDNTNQKNTDNTDSKNEEDKPPGPDDADGAKNSKPKKPFCLREGGFYSSGMNLLLRDGFHDSAKPCFMLAKREVFLCIELAHTLDEDAALSGLGLDNIVPKAYDGNNSNKQKDSSSGVPRRAKVQDINGNIGWLTFASKKGTALVEEYQE